MQQRAPQTPSILFTVRLWREEVDADAWEWRGVVKHVASGEESYFREWAALNSFVLDTANKDMSQPRITESVVALNQ